MSDSDRLRKTHTRDGGGKHIFNDEAKTHEEFVKCGGEEVLDILQANHPDIKFHRENIIYKEDINNRLKKSNSEFGSYLEIQGSSIRPDGGIIFMTFNGEQYPVLIHEAKKQGTNVARAKEGKRKQAKGNAIERAHKNVNEIRNYMRGYTYFPYVIHATGCDFEDGSSIKDRMGALTMGQPYNQIYIENPTNNYGDQEQLVTVFVRDRYYTPAEMCDNLLQVAERSIDIITSGKAKRSLHDET